LSKLKSKNQYIAVTNDKSTDYRCKILFNWTLVSVLLYLIYLIYLIYSSSSCRRYYILCIIWDSP